MISICNQITSLATFITWETEIAISTNKQGIKLYSVGSFLHMIFPNSLDNATAHVQALKLYRVGSSQHMIFPNSLDNATARVQN